MAFHAYQFNFRQVKACVTTWRKPRRRCTEKKFIFAPFGPYAPMHIANRPATSATLTSDKACANARSHDATRVATRRAPLRNQRHLGQGNLSATSATFALDKACAHARCHMSSWAHPAQMLAWQIHLRLSVMHTDSRPRMEGFWVGKFSSLQALCLQTLSLYAYINHSRSAFCIIDL